MTSPLKPIYLLQYIMMRSSLIIFWSIVICIHAILLGMIIFFSDPNESSSMFLGGAGSVYVFSFIAGILTVKDTFPLALSLGAARKHYFIGTIIFFLFLSVLQAVIVTLLGLIEGVFSHQYEYLQLYHYRLYGADNVIESIAFQLVFILFLTALANLFASWAYRVGRIFWFLLGAAMVILVTLGVMFDYVTPIFQWIVAIPSYWTACLYLLPAIVVLMLLSWLPLHKAELRKS